jgi:ATP-dependent DNA helicase 2 subunit 2
MRAPSTFFFCIQYVTPFVYLLTIQEGLVLLLDVGPSMHRALQEVENVCSTLVRKKVSKCRCYSHSKLCGLTQFIHLCNFGTLQLVYNRSDEVGIVLFGTKGTANSHLQ